MKQILYPALADFFREATQAGKDNDKMAAAILKLEKVIDGLVNKEMGNFLSRYSNEN